jgi:hypothetical protein
MKGKRLGIVVGLVFLLAITGTGFAFAGHPTVRWDIVSINFAVTPNTVSAGGVASALANDGSKITVTGSGTFQLKPGNQHVSGGGIWTTFSPVGAITGRGTYEVTGVVRFDEAPGVPNPNTDLIGNPSERHAGLAILQIEYSDGSEGTLVVSCHLVGTPDSVFEGITASKGFVDFWSRVAPPTNIDANRTLFHISE